DGGGIRNSGTLTLVASTLSGNRATGGGGIRNSGLATIVTSTLSGNRATNSGDGGGIENVAGGTLTIASSTLSGNAANSGGGSANGGTVTLQDSIVANSLAGGNCSGPPTSNGHNLSSDATCSLSGPGDLSNVNPLLGPLQFNGGPTPTQALLAGSPAIDAGDP